ncbi:MAG: glycerol-3-phosphate 1-O-acyltransferase PlsY [Alphaproteobacteria bacterium]|jgi:glycerol-3-phosphate acyltransferase PlsY
MILETLPPADWSAAWPYLLGAFVCGYALGAIPFGKIFTRWAGLGDIRDIGSGNIGATNVLRTGNKRIALLTLVFDAGKGAFAALIASGVLFEWFGLPVYWGGELMMAAAALGAFVGHIFPVGLGFRGGKGIATFFGTVLALHWPTGLVAAALWLATAFLTRYSSLGALIAVFGAPVAAFAFGDRIVAFVTLFFALMVIWSHWSNIIRLVSGTEPKIGQKKPPSENEMMGHNGGPYL